MKRFRKSLRALIGFDRRERHGTYIMSIILAVILLVRLIAFRPGEVPAVLPPLAVTNDTPAGGEAGKQVPAESFAFDPNTCTYDDLLRLGLSGRQAHTLVNYRASGARFRRPDDLLRVYGIDSVTAARLIPYIIIADFPAGQNEEKQGRKGSGSFRRGPADSTETRFSGDGEGAIRDISPERGYSEEPWTVDINICTSAELEKLPGIGPVLAERIIRYRSLLGGFVDAGQLTEVYGLDSTVARLAAVRITLTYDSVRPLVLDSASFSELARHPYIGYEVARKITRYRTVAGQPVTLGKMVDSGVITIDVAGRLAPYVKPVQGVVRTDFEFISSKVLK